MTPDKVEAALAAFQPAIDRLHRYAAHELADKLAEARVVLTEALVEKDELLDMIRKQRDVFFDEQSRLAKELAERERDAARYRGLTKVVLSVDGHGISWTWGNGSLDAVIDAAMKDTDCELSDAEMDATTDYRGHDPDYDRKDADHAR